MPVVFGEMVSSVEEIVAACDRHGDRLRGTYRAHYRFDATTIDPYTAPRLERPEALAGNPRDAIYPWEQIFLAAAACAGSDYPMLAAHFGIPLERVDFVVEGVFDPRGEFDGLGGFDAPPDARHCFRSLHFRATLVSSAPREELERIHERVMSHNMVLDGLRGVPQTSELAVLPGTGDGGRATGDGRRATGDGRRQKGRVIPSPQAPAQRSASDEGRDRRHPGRGASRSGRSRSLAALGMTTSSLRSG